MTYLLDTNTWLEYFKRRTTAVATRIASTRLSDIRLCSIVVAELTHGAYKSSRTAENLQLLEGIQKDFASLPFDDNAANTYGQIRAELERKGTPIGPNDLMIAAIALANDVTLVTHNTREFARVTSLKIEDWYMA